MLFKFEEKDGVIICRFLEHKISNAEHSLLRDAFETLINKGVTSFALDLSKVNYMGSPGIGSLITINDLSNKTAAELSKESRFVLFGLNVNVKNLLNMLKVDTFIKIAQSEEEAINWIKT